MYVVIRRYKVDPANTEEIVRRAREGFIPLIARAPGFVGYRMARAENGDLITTSTFETRAQAEESVQTAAAWVRENIAALVPNPPEVTGGEVRVRHVASGVEPRYGIMRAYQGARNIDEATRRVEADLLPTLRQTPGLGSYTVLDAGGGTVVSLSAFQDREAAERSNEQVRAWAQENLREFLPNPPEVTRAEFLASQMR
jgi:quinol monooxygenase YgiN